MPGLLWPCQDAGEFMVVYDCLCVSEWELPFSMLQNQHIAALTGTYHVQFFILELHFHDL